jgi:potassium-transporting ATPase KdpC subunit
MDMLRELVPAFRVLLLLTILTGLLYPGLVTGICQLAFPAQANGSLIFRDGKVVGSVFIGQNFAKPEYFHPRPSAVNYDAGNSGGSNLGPTNRSLIDRVKSSLEQFRRENPDYTGPIPADLVTTSASGLDPHLSPASAMAQAARVAKARGVAVSAVQALVRANTEGRTLGLLGEPRVNVLRLNLALDQRFPIRQTLSQ